ncbi:MAG: UDP-N-acetylmuramoyl-tripeptide--D-alanyl-D-alanine ligase [Acetobacter sp.]|nr:UDP-N-acetylmuramoyl-tripeptide--D-alanyl-D-alanine ligase [Acetobacter sp.]
MKPLWTRHELEIATKGRFLGDSTLDVFGVSIDTRTLRAGDLFIALKGYNSNGHAYVTTALERGAHAVMVHDVSCCPPDPRILHVTDTMAGLQALGHAARARFHGKTIAITGSVGKTTTKEMIRLCLSAYAPTHAAEASYNNHWGVPLTLARLPRDSAFCVSEIGMNHPNEILPLAHMVRPDVALITTIGTAHLGHMGSLEAIAREKASLFLALSKKGIAIVPEESHGLPFMVQATKQAGAILWQTGTHSKSQIRYKLLKHDSQGTQFKIFFAGEVFPVHLASPGLHLVHDAINALAACAACTDFRESFPKAIMALASFYPSEGRGAISTIAQGRIMLLDESYNASSTSIRAALGVLRLCPAHRRLAVLGDIGELGSFTATEHHALADPVSTVADLVFCCGPSMKTLFDALPQTHQGAWAKTSAELTPLLINQIKTGDSILVKGSLSSHMRVIVQALKTLSQEDII